MGKYLPAWIFVGILVFALATLVLPMVDGSDECGASDYQDLPPCDIDSHPPDIEIFIYNDTVGPITVTVTDIRRSKVVLSRRISGENRTARLKDVITESGTYLVEAESDAGSADRYRWDVDEHVPTGGPVVTVTVLENETVTVEPTSYP